ncbi:MAG: hypothetical protein BroJett040_21110 [Oligoflexia bacterium]|nr:MAG: hypothetical protein BroJett040_21110 [Oligoflexia bacterium]
MSLLQRERGSEFSPEILSRRRFPRLFLTPPDMELKPMSGVQIMWPNRSYSQVFSMSLGGIMVSTQGILGQVRLGQVYDCKLKIEGAAEIPVLRLRVLRMTAQAACMIMESISSEGRLKIDQALKDELIVHNLGTVPTANLHPSLRADLWIHGPFDTNFLIWKNPDWLEIDRAIVEYDGLAIVYEKGIITTQKSQPTTDEAKGYGGPWFDTQVQKVSMGASWKQRLIKLLHQRPDLQQDLTPVYEILSKANED